MARPCSPYGGHDAGGGSGGGGWRIATFQPGSAMGSGSLCLGRPSRHCGGVAREKERGQPPPLPKNRKVKWSNRRARARGVRGVSAASCQDGDGALTTTSKDYSEGYCTRCMPSSQHGGIVDMSSVREKPRAKKEHKGLTEARPIKGRRRKKQSHGLGRRAALAG